MTDLVDRRAADHALADIAYPHILAGVHIRPLALPTEFLEGESMKPLASEILRDGLVVDHAETQAPR